MSAKSIRYLLFSLIQCWLVIAASGCSEKPKVVDAEPIEDAAGSVAMGRAKNPAGAAAGAGSGGNAGSGEVATSAAASGEESSEVSDVPTAEAETEHDYGWVKFEHTPFGEGKTPNADLRRQVKVTMLGETAMDGKAYVMRSSSTTSYVDVALAISNSNPDLRCFVKAESVVWKTADGAVIPGDDHALTYLSGSVGNSSDSPTTTCLGPGEKGYLLEIQGTQSGMDSLFDTLAEVELTLTASGSSFERPKYRVLATSWEGSKDKLEVTFKNLGIASAPIELGQGEYILTDADGKPLSWGFLDAHTGLTALGPGEKLVLTSDIYYDGKASNLLVSFGY
jgi:hypothetical protein